MAAHETRLLLLGAVALFEPVNGYQIRRELISWHVDEWANVNPGSIYSGLATLTKQGHIDRSDLMDGTRAVAVYELTDLGRAELDRLFAASVETVDLHSAVAFHVAFGMLPLIDRQQVLGHLDVRKQALEKIVDELPDAYDEKSQEAPPHALRGLLLWRDLAVTELAWLRHVIADIKKGKLAFKGEESDWVPRPDDPGWQMQTDREKYRALLGR